MIISSLFMWGISTFITQSLIHISLLSSDFVGHRRLTLKVVCLRSISFAFQFIDYSKIEAYTYIKNLKRKASTYNGIVA